MRHLILSIAAMYGIYYPPTGVVLTAAATRIYEAPVFEMADLTKDTSKVNYRRTRLCVSFQQPILVHMKVTEMNI